MKKVCVLLTFLLVTKGFAATTHNQGRLYDCAANSLYLFCSLTNNQISYDKSIKLLPMTDKGNSMLEINNGGNRGTPYLFLPLIEVFSKV